MFKYCATINITDTDYRSSAGTTTILVDSWEDAENQCKKMKSRGCFYYVKNLKTIEVDDKGRYKEVFNSYYEWSNRTKR